MKQQAWELQFKQTLQSSHIFKENQETLWTTALMLQCMLENATLSFSFDSVQAPGDTVKRKKQMKGLSVLVENKEQGRL